MHRRATRSASGWPANKGGNLAWEQLEDQGQEQLREAGRLGATRAWEELDQEGREQRKETG